VFFCQRPLGFISSNKLNNLRNVFNQLKRDSMYEPPNKIPNDKNCNSQELSLAYNILSLQDENLRVYLLNLLN